MNRAAVQRAAWVAGALTLAGAFLALVTIQTEALSFAARFQGIERAIYRIGYLLRIPAAPVAGFIFPVRNHHWPWAHILFTCFAAPFLWYGAHWLARRAWRRAAGSTVRPESRATGMTRRSFVAGALAGVGGTAAATTGGYGLLIEPQQLQVREYAIPLPDLPSELAGARMLHVSDTHYGPFISMAYLESMVRKANALGADFAILTGDYVHRTPRAIEPGVRLFERLRTRLGALAVLGNHDHWEGAAAVERHLTDAGIPVLTNKRLFLSPRGFQSDAGTGPCLCIAGVDDLWEGQVLLDRALAGVPEGMPRIVLSHNPDVAEQVPAGLRVDLMCCGHTHGGQVSLPVIGPPILPSAYGQKYAGGLCQGPHGRVLVSRGVGMALLPVRLGVPPEIAVITLTRA